MNNTKDLKFTAESALERSANILSLSLNDIIEQLLSPQRIYRNTHTSNGSSLEFNPIKKLPGIRRISVDSDTDTVLDFLRPRTISISNPDPDLYGPNDVTFEPHFMVFYGDIIFPIVLDDIIDCIEQSPHRYSVKAFKVISQFLIDNVNHIGQFVSFEDMALAMGVVYNAQANLIPITQRKIHRTSFRQSNSRTNSFSASTESKNPKEITIERSSERVHKRLLIQNALPELDVTCAHAQPQMYPFNLPINLDLNSEVLDTIENLSNNIGKGIDVNHKVDDQVIDLLTKITNIFEKSGLKTDSTVTFGIDPKTTKTLAVAAAILAVTLAHQSQPSKTSLGIMMAVIGASVMTYGFDSFPGISTIVSDLTSYVVNYSKTQPQMSPSLLENIVSSLVMMFIAIATGSTTNSWSNEIVKQALGFKRNHESLSMCLTSVLKLFEMIATFISRDILGGETLRFLYTNRADVNAFLDKVNKLSDELHHNNFAFTPQNATFIHQMWVDCRSLIAAIPRGEDSGIILALNNACQYLYTQKKVFDGMNLTTNGSRVEPVSALFLGPPGTGKSNLLYPLSYTILMKTLHKDKIDQFKADPNSFIYNRQPETVYWDGYNMDKVICFIDDLGQLRDVAGNPDNEWMNWIRMCSSFNYVLHMAALEKKGNVHFQSRFVFANSNLKTFNIESIIEIEAFERRVDFCYICVPKPEFCKEGTSNGPVWGRRLDNNKLPTGPLGITELSPETSEFIEFDIMTKRESGRILTYQEVCVDLIAKADIKQKRFDQTQITLNKILAENNNNIIPQARFEFPSSSKPLDPRVTEFNNKIQNNKIKDEIRLYILGSFNHVNGWETSLDVAIPFFFNCLGDEFMDLANADEVELSSFLGKIESLDLDNPNQYLPKLPNTNLFSKLKSTLGKVYDFISNLITNSKNACLRMFEFYKLKIHPHLHVYLSVMAGITLYVNRSDIISRFFPSWNTDNEAESYSGKPQRDRNSKIRKPVNSKMFREKATKIPTVAPATQSSNKYDNSNVSIVQKIIKRNCYELWLPDQEVRVGFVTFIKGRTFAMPKHFATNIYYILEDFPEYKDRLVTFKKSGSSIEYQCKMTDMMNIVSSTSLETLDCVLIQAPIHFNVHANITKHFMTRDEIAKYKIIDFRLVLPGTTGFESWMGKAFPITKEIITCDVTYVLDKGFKYQALTKSGDCGGLFTVVDNFSGSAKILGFHVAGAPSSGTGIATCVCYEDVVTNIPQDEIHYDFEDDLFPQMNETILDGRFEEKYVHKYTASSAVDTKIIKSELHSMWVPAKTRPAKLRSFKLNNNIIDPYENALSKYCTPFVYIDPKIIEHIGNNVFDNLNKKSQVNVEKRLLSFEESILGIDSEPDFAAISRTTSLGFPDNSLPGRKFKGKTEYFGNAQEYDITTEKATELIAECKVIENLARQNTRVEHIYTDCLKDERRPHEKVDSGRTRLFSSCPVRLLILFRRYFGSFILWCAKNKINNGFAVGVNPYSTDWELISQELLKYGTHTTANVGAGDYSGYDGRLKPIVSWNVLENINVWYSDEHAAIRRVLWLEVVNSNHIHGNIVYMWISSSPSGHPITTLLNNIYNHYVANYCWFRSHANDLSAIYTFYDFVYFITLGDDNLFSVSLTKTDKFNEIIMEKYSSEIGMKYTSETKGDVGNLRSITQVSFLKRKFRFEPIYDRFCAPLELDVVLEIPYWTKSCSFEDSITHDNVNTAIKELALHGAEIFDKYTPLIVNAYKTKYNRSPDIIRRFPLLKIMENCKEWY